MFFEIPKIFDRNFITGYFLPSIVFGFWTIVLIKISFNINLFDFRIDNTGRIAISSAENSLFFLGLIFVACSIISISLLMVNRFLIRLMEGYYYPVKLLTPFQRYQYSRMEKNFTKLKRNYQLERKSGGNPHPYHDQISKLKLKQAIEFPYHKDFIIGTRFGNILRSAETYSRKMYGADIIPLWSRIIPVVDDAHKNNLSDAKAGVDFAVNSFYIAIALAIQTIVLFQYSNDTSLLWRKYWFLFVLFLVGITGAYNLAISRVRLWGNYIRATSDLYLDKLLSTLGYEKPTEEDDAKALWESICVSFLYYLPFPPNPFDKSNDKDK